MRSLAALSLLVFSSAAYAQPSFLKDTFEEMLRESPEFATGVGRHEYDDRWTDWSKAARDQRRQFLEQCLAQLDSGQTGGIPVDRLSKSVIHYDFQSRLEAWDLDTHLLRVGQQFGFHDRVYLVVDEMPAYTIHDYENIVARLRAVPAYVDQNIGILDEAIASGIMQPRVVADLVIGQLDVQAKQTADQTELLKAFRAFPESIPKADQQRLLKAAQDAYNQQFLPAWHKLHDYMVATYLPHVRPADSILSMPGGRAAYTILIHEFTTTTMSAAEIHQLERAGSGAH